ncbi:AAA family ATPase [Planosporangium flavigriseum]|uniref:Nuclease SbcCD subunit C n=1 Tax=Planosporangium flavigriseum TaxID=373681 RepID=A0A8J3LHS7_9ACTN|nr:AAA family ATPase [Planosporangium flavigriseum]NJC62938.1 AAA family ATPase [Planosporangium flavigriseum]GIG73197.1 hypothetical protein Pfl04_16010 [Planosporangium flavigriseum]
MTVPETSTVDQLILQHLDTANLPESSVDLVFAALLGQSDLDAALGGATTARPAASPENVGAAEPIGTYLSSIEVCGFRGIGQGSRLDLTPGPGLTIVTGRNGSGKSSFAEAAELALTGDNKRWAGRASVWQDGWRNLHASEEPYIRVRLGVDGHRNGAAVECHWTRDGGLADRTSFLQVTGQPRQSVADLGWDRPLELYRPFLSYAELGGLIGGRPSEMYDSLQRILGLGRLVEVENMLKTARKAMDGLRPQATAQLPALRSALAAHPDPRARQAEESLAGKDADLDRLELLADTDEHADTTATAPLRQLDVLELPERNQAAEIVDRLNAALRDLAELAGTPAEEARALARLLGEAISNHEAHPDQPCPVCGGRTLDTAWAEQARTELRRLTQRAERIEGAHRSQRESRRALRDFLPVIPRAIGADLTGVGLDTGAARAAWQRWDELLGSDDPRRIADEALETFDAVVAAVQPLQAAARAVLERQRQAWRPLVDQLRAWVATARKSQRAAENYTALRKAITWVQGIGQQIRNDKLAPVARDATTIWNTLRQESNVDLGAIRLAGTGTSRRVDLDVTVDGTPGAALSVMSQGELHSLALALFLPRATIRESPFRFLIIDDPVQSMDPVKVYGLAKVLDQVARDRQVVVFTHDDRLPAAVRHLQLKARVLTVSRLARSQVTVDHDGKGDPAARYLDDAWAIARDGTMADKIRSTVVCNLIRDALEYTCQEAIRRRDFRAGRPIMDTETAISDANGLRPLLALALLNDAGRVGELPGALQRLHSDARRVVAAVNGGAHGDHQGAPLTSLVDDARRVNERLARS